ncbi:MAG: asparagine synthase [Nitrospira sp.]|nr:asparagine synthase [Nitrospira sp.]
MARIAGLYFRDDRQDRTGLIQPMLAASRGDGNWAAHTQRNGSATLGWTGWRFPGLTDTHGVLVALDGRIYNRSDFNPTAGDAELIAELYTHYGFEKALCRLNGDFAIALYDRHADTLWLARDRFGVKPLYYVNTRDWFAFASRPAALLALPGSSRNINRRFAAIFAGGHYRYFDNHPDESTYQDIAQLPAGHVLRVSHSGLHMTRYWSLSEEPDFTAATSELAEQYRHLLIDAVVMRVKAASNPAFTLSGGMDSSSVVASAIQASNGTPHAFSTVYDDKTYDESRDIQPMVEATGLQWHPVAVGAPDVFTLVQRMVRIHDEPVATATWLSQYLLCSEVQRRGFGGLFGGLGGDELNAGEYEYFLYFFADLKAAGRENQLQEEVIRWIEHHDHPVFRKSARLVEEGLEGLVDLSVPGRCLPDRRRLRRYYAAVDKAFFDLERFEPVMEHPFSSYLKNRTYQDMFRETLPCCLRAEDRNAVKYGLEHFLPFLDHRLVEFMFRVAGAEKIRRGVTKYLLREAMKGILPEETRIRIKKTGWNAPAHVWFSGTGLDNLRDLVASRSFRQRGLYHVSEVERLVAEHQQIVESGRLAENHMMFLWQLVNLELWLRWNDEASANDAGRRVC